MAVVAGGATWSPFPQQQQQDWQAVGNSYLVPIVVRSQQWSARLVAAATGH
jgi:hypothetical protein